MTRLTRLWTLLALTLFFVGCQREVSFNGTGGGTSDISPLPDPITSALQGNVFDENGQPASGVMVHVGSAMATTDAGGYFRILNAALDKKASLVTAEKAGYFKAFRTFAATSGANHIEIKLKKRNLAGSIDAAAGGEVSFDGASKVALPANGVVVAATNAAYTGQVKIYAAYIDPSANDIYQTVPGSFQANNTNGQRVILTSYGMVAVELEGAAGEKLQVKSGLEATLTTAIPSAALASAPSSIPLWYVDEATGIWKEEGSALKNGNVYVGKVKHFTYWNCDIQGPTVMSSATIKTTDGAPLVNAHVSITRANTQWGASAHGFTDSLGQINGPVPANEALVLRVLDPCGNVAYSQNIGPYSSSTNLGVITISNATAPSLLQVTGTLLDCNGQPVTSGYAIVWSGYNVRYASVNSSGQFSVSYLTCNTITSVSVMGVNAANQQQSGQSTFNVSAPATNVGTITACGTSSAEYINYTLDGNAQGYTSAAGDSLMANSSMQGTTATAYIGGGSIASTNNSSIYLTSNANAAGSFPVMNISVGNLNQNTVLAPFNIVYTSWPTAAGQFYEGTFSGSFKDASNVTHTVTNGSFRIRKMW